jgi:hypothetical protein
MKKIVMMLGLVAAATGSAVHAENTQVATEAVATQLSADEMAFAAKLDDKNRKAFGDKFSAEQRKAIMVAVKNGANADLAVQNMLAAQGMKETPAVAQAEQDEADDMDLDTSSVK